jgi:hypothetical protein
LKEQLEKKFLNFLYLQLLFVQLTYMRALLFFFLSMVLLFSKAIGQSSPTDKHILDSLLQFDEALKMFGGLSESSSYVRINVGFGNKLYTTQDRAIEALQNGSQLVVTPSVAYYHKSGFGISGSAFLLSENGQAEFAQYSITPFFNYTKGRVADAMVSYSHYFERSVYSTNTSPVQNEYFGSVVFKKPWLKPGISAAYSSGTFHEIIKIDTTVRIANQRIHIKYTDTTTTKLTTFSLTGTVGHTFTFFNIFAAHDGIGITPQISVITGVNNYSVSHKSTLANYNAFTKKLAKRIRHFQSQAGNSKYEAQSLGLDLDLNYSIGKFYVEPEAYMDYYLPNTNDNRFTQIFNVNIGITF